MAPRLEMKPTSKSSVLFCFCVLKMSPFLRINVSFVNQKKKKKIYNDYKFYRAQKTSELRQRVCSQRVRRRPPNSVLANWPWQVRYSRPSRLGFLINKLEAHPPRESYREHEVTHVSMCQAEQVLHKCGYWNSVWLLCPLQP